MVVGDVNVLNPVKSFITPTVKSPEAPVFLIVTGLYPAGVPIGKIKLLDAPLIVLLTTPVLLVLIILK